MTSTNITNIVASNAQSMSSIEIAQLTEKLHKNVIADVEALHAYYQSIYSAEKSAQLIQSSTYKDASGKSNKCYLLSKDSALDLVTGYSLPHRHAVNQRWLELESQQAPPFQIPKTLSEALLLAGQLAAEKEAALAQIEADKPKVEFAETVRNMQGACSVGDFAKAIGYGRNKLFKMMRDDLILMGNNIPYQRYIDMGCFVVVEQIPYTDSKGKTHPAFTTMVTGKGQVFLEKKYRQLPDARNGLVLLQGGMSCQS